LVLVLTFSYGFYANSLDDFWVFIELHVENLLKVDVL
jgi:hypothetical protein